MIVDPDFFDHWRTRMVADALQDSMAPVYIMRLWGHCQNRKGDVFDIPAAGIKALCQFVGDAQALEDALIAAEYMERDGLTITVTGWAEKNSALLAAWENGHKGGRPKKNPPATKTEPIENPTETHGIPMDNPPLTQTKPIRVDKSREEKKEGEGTAGKPARAPVKTSIPDEFGVSDRVRCWAREKGFTQIDAHLESFVRKCRAKNYKNVSWDDAFMEAIREDWAKLRGGSANGIAPPPKVRGFVQ
jgi:hypothetical protein